MSDATLTISLRDECKSMTQEEFASAYTRAQLELKASEAGVEDETITAAKTKADVVALVYGQYKFPDPALRGNSTVDHPVSAMWALLNLDLDQNGPEKKMRRKDGVAAGEKLGIAHYTARTQYQAWFEATDKGTKPIGEGSSPDGLPKEFAKALGLIVEKVEEVASK